MVNGDPGAPPPPGGGSGANQGAGNGKKGKGNTGTYNVPGAPDPTGTPLALQGTYLDQANAAQTAYQNAVNQLNAQRQQYYAATGLNANGSSFVNDPTSQWGQLSANLGQQAHGADMAIHNRGLSGGLANMLMGQERTSEGIQRNHFTEGVAGQAQNFANLQQNAADTLTNTQDAIRSAFVNYMISNGQHVTAAGQLDQGTVNDRVAKLAKAWMNTWGGYGKDNKKGQTFQEFLNSLNLYDPNAHYGVGKVNY